MHTQCRGIWVSRQPHRTHAIVINSARMMSFYVMISLYGLCVKDFDGHPVNGAWRAASVDLPLPLPFRTLMPPLR